MCSHRAIARSVAFTVSWGATRSFWLQTVGGQQQTKDQLGGYYHNVDKMMMMGQTVGSGSGEHWLGSGDSLKVE